MFNDFVNALNVFQMNVLCIFPKVGRQKSMDLFQKIFFHIRLVQYIHTFSFQNTSFYMFISADRFPMNNGIIWTMSGY